MPKMVVMIKRKGGTTPEQFRAYYEGHHSKLMRHFADCITDYRRSYPVPNPIAPDTVYNPSGADLPDVADGEFDCITEVWLKDPAALRTLYERMAQPEIAAIFKADIDRFTDPSRTRFVICRECHGI